MNNRRDELIEWLFSSRDGERSIVPFTTVIAMQDRFYRVHGITWVWQGVTFDRDNWKIHLVGRGSIEFVNIGRGIEFLNDRTWDHAFELQGPRQHGQYADTFMHALSRRVAANDIVMNVESVEQK